MGRRRVVGEIGRNIKGVTMDDELIIKASPKKGLLIVLLSLGFGAVSIWLIGREPILGWVGTIFAGLGLLASLSMLRPNHMYLRLDREGFTFVRGKRQNRTRWRDVAGFSPGKMSGNKMIAIQYTPDYARAKVARTVASSLAGVEGGIFDHYAMPIEQLYETLEAYRRRHG
jgi:hypothetical protein